MKKNSVYMERAMKSRDPRFAKVLGKLGYSTRDMIANPVVAEVHQEQPTPVETLDELRSRYYSTLGKRPYYGWDEAELLKRINEANE